MEDSAYLGSLIAGFLFLGAGSRLLLLASRTGETPERLLGWSLVAMGGSYLFYQAAIILDDESLWTPLTFLGRIGYLPAVVALSMFTRRVFRPEGAVSTSLVWTPSLLMAVGIGVSALGGDWEGYSIANPWFWAEWLGYTIPFAWVSAEAIPQYASARKRMKLGLCSATVCNRFLLWALFGIVELVVSGVILVMYTEFEAEGAFSTWADTALGGLESLGAVLVWLVFFPPVFYRRWLERPSALES